MVIMSCKQLPSVPRMSLDAGRTKESIAVQMGNFLLAGGLIELQILTNFTDVRRCDDEKCA